MSNRAKRIIIVVALAQLLLAAIFITLPRVVEALPGRVRVRLPQALTELVTTPIPTSLPAPRSETTTVNVTIPALSFEPSTEPSATVEPLSEATATPSDEERATATPTAVPPTETPSPTPSPSPSPTPLPDRVVLDGLVNIPQSFNNCGPANMTIVLNYYQDPTTQTDAALFLKPNPEDRNVSPWQINDYVNDHTSLRSTAHSGGTLELLKNLIAAGFPVVVEKGYDPTAADGWYGHYLTVFGYDDTLEELYSMDTYLGPFNETGRVDSYEELNRYWQHFNYTFYVIYPPDQEEVLFEILGPEMLDPLTMWQNTALRAQAETEANPEDAFAWFNLGTSLTRLGESTGNQEYYQNGAAAFDQARTIGLPGRMLWYQFRPYVAYMKTGRFQDMLDLADSTLSTQGGRNVEETYLYKGHALSFLGDVPGAIAAFEEALRLNENFYLAQWALDSLQ